jgi:hypothetical protein
MISDFYIHTVTVQTFTGTGSHGPEYAPGVQVDGFLDGAQKVLFSKEGIQVLSSSTFYCDPSNQALFTINSLVTTPSSGVGRVRFANAYLSGMLGLPDHLLVKLV